MNVLRTPKKIEQARRNAQICAEYKALREKYPTSSDALIFNEIAKGYDIQAPAIRTVCKANGLC